MLPDIWGKDMWNSMERIAYDYPENPTEDDKNNYRDFFLILQYVLPCGGCRTNYQKHLIDLPLTDKVMSSRINLLDWIINMHNTVNISLGKPILDHDEAMEKINNLAKPQKKSNWFYILLLIVVIIIIIFLIYYLKLKNN